jgi:hypothetical protein
MGIITAVGEFDTLPAEDGSVCDGKAIIVDVKGTPSLFLPVLMVKEGDFG